jgi:hypothetical protein
VLYGSRRKKFTSDKFVLLTVLVYRIPPSSSPLEPLTALKINVLRINLNYS